MHPDRLSFLAYNNAQIRKVTECISNDSGAWEMELECGHKATCVAHMDASLSKEWKCMPCGLEYVKTAPQYTKEFENN